LDDKPSYVKQNHLVIFAHFHQHKKEGYHQDRPEKHVKKSRKLDNFRVPKQQIQNRQGDNGIQVKPKSQTQKQFDRIYSRQRQIGVGILEIIQEWIVKQIVFKSSDSD